MSRLKNRGESNSRNAFSFILPFVIALFFIIIVMRYIFSPSSTGENHTGSFINVTPKQEQGEIYIYMSGDSKKRIDATTKMYTTDSKLVVANGEAELGFENNISKFFLDKGGEFRYGGVVNGKQVLSLDNSYLWAESANTDMNLKLKSLVVTPGHDSIVIVNQNAIASNVYVLKGNALVETTTSTPASGTVGVGQQLTVLGNEIGNVNFKIAEKIEPISDFIKTTDIFIRHDGVSLLASLSGDTESGGTSTGTTTSSGSIGVKNGKSDIIITSPEDESTVDSNEITVEGKIVNSAISKVTINDKNTSIDKENKSFIYKGLILTNTSNDIIYKAFDSEGNMVSKGILTVYTSKKTGSIDASKKPTVVTYPISDKDFQIFAPTENPYKTTEDVVRIEGRVNKGVVKFITVNDFRLSKFSQFGTVWYYFANKDYGTMNDGINLYTIKYYGENDELLFTNLFTIVKEKKEEGTSISGSGTNNGSGTGSSTGG